MQSVNQPLHFVGNAGTGDDLEMLSNLNWDGGCLPCVHHAWVWPVFCHLRDLGLPVSYSYELKAGAINFIHGEVARYQLSGSDFRDHFIVGMRADFRPMFYANLEVVQNKKQTGRRAFYMQHFPQPGLLPRDAAREGVTNVCFSGQIENFGSDVQCLETDLEKLGCRFVHKNLGQWHDMSDVDVLLGMRSFSKNPYDSKPATKMFNAWLAGIPFIGGYDSAYEQAGRPGVNYMQVSSYDEMIEAVRRLKQDPEFYRAMADAGREAGKSYTHDETGRQWAALIKEGILPAYEKWTIRGLTRRMSAVLRGTSYEIWEQQIRGYKRAAIWGG